MFAEGFTFLNDSTVCLLTWREHTAFIISTRSMEILDEFTFQGEGWGLCYDGNGTRYQSNGSSVITLRSPDTFEPLDSISVTLNGQPQVFLNELEFAFGYILANQWQTTRILFIDPESGVVERVVNLGNAAPDGAGAMNGIAVSENGQLFCSGKNWPVTFILDASCED